MIDRGEESKTGGEGKEGGGYWDPGAFDTFGADLASWDRGEGAFAGDEFAVQTGVGNPNLVVGQQTPPAETVDPLGNIPVDQDYSDAEAQEVANIINSGQMTVNQVATRFNLDPSVVQTALDRINTANAGGGGDADETKTITCYNAAGESTQVTGVNPVCKAPFPLSSPPAGTTPAWETAMKDWIAANPNATDAQGAAWLNANLPAGVTLADAAAALNIPLEDAQKRFAIATKGKEATRRDVLGQSIANINLTKVDDPSTPKDESLERVPGAVLKDYQRVDPSMVISERIAPTAISRAGTVTPEESIQQLDAYQDITAPEGVPEASFEAAKGRLREAIVSGQVPIGDYNAHLANILNTPQFAKDMNRAPVDAEEIRQLTERVREVAFRDRPGTVVEESKFEVDPESFVPGVTPREKIILAPTREAEQKLRSELTTTASNSVEAEITNKADYDYAERKEVTGEAAIAGAIEAVAKTVDLPPEVAKAIVDDAGSVAEKIDGETPEVIAAVAALPAEALVSAQIESLMGGMETGNIPTWAKPAYDAVNQKLAQRGLEVSTVGRDALFNAIIQNAIPIAQSNAQALQQRAAQNLSNEQQANLQQAQLDANRRLANIGNQQTAASQAAQFAQDIKLTRGQFEQAAITLSEQQEQQIRVQNLQNRQRSAEITAQQGAANAAQNLGNRQQIELAELEIKNQTEQQNMTAQNQERLAEFQVASEYISKNGDFAQQMQLANLSNDQQIQLANLTSRNQYESENLTAKQQTELANLNTRMQTNLTAANLAQQMGLAQLNVDQQRAIQNASMVANIDLTKFSDVQQAELVNSRFMQTVSLTDFNSRQQAVMQDATALASLDMAAVDQRTKLRITQAQDFLQRDMANLNNEQQSYMLAAQAEQQRYLSDQSALNAAEQFNASSENQIEQFRASLASQLAQFNSTQHNAMEQFNASEYNRVEAINAGNTIDAAKFNNQVKVQVDQFNEQYDLQRDQWNAANAQAVEQSNVEWRRQANTLDTAAVNAANQQNAMNSFNINAQEQNFLWQELRDEAAYLRQGYENEEQRKSSLYATSLANESQETSSKYSTLIGLVDTIFAK